MEGDAVERSADRSPGGGRWSGNIVRPAGRLFRGPRGASGSAHRCSAPRRRIGSDRLRTPSTNCLNSRDPSGTRGSMGRWSASRWLRSAMNFARAREHERRFLALQALHRLERSMHCLSPDQQVLPGTPFGKGSRVEGFRVGSRAAVQLGKNVCHPDLLCRKRTGFPQRERYLQVRTGIPVGGRFAPH